MPKNNLANKRGKSKIKISDKRDAAMQRIVDTYSEEFDVKIAVIQELIPLGLKAVVEELQAEAKRLAGERYPHGGDNARWGKQNGSVYLRDQKVPIKVPRVRNSVTNEEVQLESYQRLQKPFDGDDQTVLKLLHGLSTHQYSRSASLAGEVFGVSPSNLSKRFKVQTTKTLKQFYNRSLKEHDIVCIFIDGKRFADDGLIIALGITIDGTKIFLGIEQTHTENAKSIEQWMDRLVERGLKF